MSSLQYNASNHRYVVVLGSMGTGKSTFIKNFLSESADQPECGSGPACITSSQASYRDRTGQFTLIDTVGLDYYGYVYNHKELVGRNVAFVFLLDSSRWKSQQEQFIKQLGWNEKRSNMNFYLAWKSPHSKGSPASKESPTSITSVKSLEQLTFDVIQEASHYQCDVAIAPHSSDAQSFPAADKIVLKPELKEQSRLRHRQTESILLFHKDLSQLNHRQTNLLDLFHGKSFVQTCKQKPMNDKMWKLITQQDEVTRYRNAGDLILKYFLEHIYRGEPQVQHHLTASNDSLASIVHKKQLNTHIRVMFGEDNLNHETLGDYLEALFEKILASHPAYVVDFLRQIMDIPTNDVTNCL